MEKPKYVIGYKNYIIYPDGQIFSIVKGMYLTWIADSDGYYRVNLWKNHKYKTHYIHRLVATHYISNPNGYLAVNHKDMNKTNNHFSNLEWCTNEYNLKHA